MDLLITLATEPIEQLLRSFNSSPTGLSEKEAEKRILTNGKNLLIEKNQFTIPKLLWESFFSPLVVLLLVASLISSILGDFKDFFIIFGIVLLSGGITFYQHFKAEKAGEKLTKKVQLNATVVRDGIRREIPFSKIVPGDVVFLGPGDIVPADGRILEEKDLSIDESTLTGESFPAQKSLHIRPDNIHALSKLSTLVFAGTHVITGEATVCIIATGKKTQLGKLSHEILKPKPPTDFDIGIERLSILMVKVIILLCLFVFGVNALVHHEIIVSFTFAVALAVGLTPELMPVILTINLTRGALRMEKKEVIVKYLPAIQNFGSMDILCIDKTGTLTENTITLTDYQNVAGETSDTVLLYGILDASLKSGIKDPLDHAILKQEHHLSLEGYKKVDEIPFDFIRKRASVIIENDNTYLLITKGAPQKVLPLCHEYQSTRAVKPLSLAIAKHVDHTIQELNKKGLRVLLVASKKIKKQNSYDAADENKLTLIGMLIFEDRVKATVSSTIKEMKSLGISIKILTGDNELVTQKVCEEVHLPILGTLLGEEIDSMGNDQLQQAVEQNTIFARLTPEQKQRIIEAFKMKNHVVGFLGDGVNDAPPLKTADVGISVNNGSDIARDVADIVLMRKSLSVLKEGILEGRKTHANIFKYIFMSLSSNFGNMISIAVASLFLPFLPLLPTQILLINFLYDFSQITIPMDNVDTELTTKPQQWNISFIKNFILTFGPISSFFDICTFIGLLYLFHSSIAIFRTGWFLESIITQTAIIFLIRTRRVPFIRSFAGIPVFITAAIAIFTGFFFINSPLAPLFNFARLPIAFYFFLGIVLFVYATTVELGKFWFYKKFIR